MFTIGEITGLRTPVRGHDGKRAFRSAGAAEAGLRALRRLETRETGAELRDGDTLHVYRCTVGGIEHWHYGHDRKRSDERN